MAHERSHVDFTGATFLRKYGSAFAKIDEGSRREKWLVG
jgi:hypothetical protein